MDVAIMHRFQNKKIIIPVALVLIIALGAGIYLFRQQQHNQAIQPEQPFNLAPATDAEKKEVEENKTSDKEGPTSSSRTPSSDPNAPTTATISTATFDAANDRVVVQTQLMGKGWKKCTLELQQGNAIVTKTVDTLYQADFSTCMGFSVEGSELTTTGAWQVKLSASNDDGKTYTSEAKTVNVTK